MWAYWPVQSLCQYIRGGRVVQRQGLIQFTRSLTSGASVIAGGFANYTLSFDIGYTFGPWEISELNMLEIPEIVKEKVQGARGFLNSLSWPGSYDILTDRLGSFAKSMK